MGAEIGPDATERGPWLAGRGAIGRLRRRTAVILLRIGTPGHGRWDTPTPPAFYDGDQLVPFQCMISVRGWPDAVV